MTELRRRGEAVVYVTMRRFQQDVEAAGAVFRAYEDLSDEVSAAFNPNVLRAPSVAKLAATLTEWRERLLCPLTAFVREEAPDYIVRDIMALWGHDIGRCMKLPTIATMPILPLKDLGIATLSPALFWDVVRSFPHDLPAYLRFLRSAARLRRNHGVAPTRFGAIFFNRSALNIVFTSRLFHPHGDAFGDDFVFVGPSIAPRPSEGARIAWEKIHRPLVYISLGTVYNTRVDFFRTCLEALGSEPLTVLIALGIGSASISSVPSPITSTSLRSRPSSKCWRTRMRLSRTVG